MFSIKQSIFMLILLQSLICYALSASAGTLSAQYGRISNMPDYRIHVAAALTLTDCIRECVDFARNYDIYAYEECFAYNYDIDKYTCELIHSTAAMAYTIGFQTRWQTGLKY